MKIAIVGYGHVGKALHKVFPNATPYDPYVDVKTTKDEVNQCSLVFICVPTPGDGDIAVVEEVVGWVGSSNPDQVICIKSTVPPGTTRMLGEKYDKRIVFSPEYQGETPWQKSIEDWPFVIAGGDPDAAGLVLREYGKVLGPQKKYFKTDSTTAELVKYAENAWLAMQVTWANEMHEICRIFGQQWGDVRELWALDPRVSMSHTLVFEENRGFSGKCLPKDLDAIIKASTQQGYAPGFLSSIREANQRFALLNEQTEERDTAIGPGDSRW